ncbi:MAG: SPFH domain-containing protein [Aquabacterium sp.]
MSTTQGKNQFEQTAALRIGGWLALLIWLMLAGLTAWHALAAVQDHGLPFLELAMGVALLLATKGFVVIAPNLAVVLTFFGKYVGTIAEDGFFWCNPLATRRMVSLRINNFTTETIKVNDKNGNPVEVGAVISWRIRDTAKAVFSVNDYTSFIEMACESAIREVVSGRVYDHSTDDGDTSKTLRGDLDGVAQDLMSTVEAHVDVAGVDIHSAKITHLAYAPEIAMAMLRKQQAAAVVAARKLIVSGAVGMVKDAVDEIQLAGIVEFKGEERAALVINLLTVLVSESEAQPVLTLNK